MVLYFLCVEGGERKELRLETLILASLTTVFAKFVTKSKIMMFPKKNKKVLTFFPVLHVFTVSFDLFCAVKAIFHLWSLLNIRKIPEFKK